MGEDESSQFSSSTRTEDTYRAAGQQQYTYSYSSGGKAYWRYQAKENPGEAAARRRREEAQEQTRAYQEAAWKRERDHTWEEEQAGDWHRYTGQQTAHKSDWDVIGVKPNCAFAEAKVAYRQKIAQVHPDRHPDSEKDQWTAQAQAVNVAWDTLCRAQGWLR